MVALLVFIMATLDYFVAQKKTKNKRKEKRKNVGSERSFWR